MLLELTVQNLLFAKNARLEPGQGLTVVSGETGSGKSLLLGALQLVLGGRATTKLVGKESPHALVTAVFEHSPIVHRKILEMSETHGFPLNEDESVILKRQISAKGRTQAWINDTPISVNVLREVGQSLVDVQGQHEPLRLAERGRQMEVLDSYAGNKKLVVEYVTAVHQLRAYEQELRTLLHDEQKHLKERDYCRYLLEEIDELEPREAEFEELEQQQLILAGAEEWRALAEKAAHQLSESDSAINRKVGKLASDLLESPDQRLRDAGELCQQAESLLRDASMLCLDAGDSIQGDPAALAACEERLSHYVGLMRKHGGTPVSLLNAQAELHQRLTQLENTDERKSELDALVEQQHAAVLKQGRQLAKLRRQAFKKLAAAILPHLNDLGMPEARIELAESKDEVIDLLGICHQEFLAQTNPGIAADKIGAVASGGEHARLALALALVLGDSDDVPVMVFDEIDSGVGARLGVAIGHKLAILAKSRSVVVITHTPQVAAMAQHHYLVRKTQSQDATRMDVQLMVGADRLKELTDMLGGGPAASQQAQELLALA